MATVAQLKAIIGADTGGFDRGIQHAQAGMERFAKSVTGIGAGLSAVLTVPIVAFGAAAVRSATEMDSLTRGLRAVAGSAGEADKQLSRLREIAKLPGLGRVEAIRASISLQAAGISAKRAERSLLAFGNALATVGKGKADLDGVTLALTQIASKGKISAEEINQLSERVPQIRKAMQAAFGTADTEVLQKAKLSATEFIDGITRELLKLPRVTGGAQNAFENLSDTVNDALSTIGKNVLPTVTSLAERLADTLTDLTGKFSALTPQTRQAILVFAAFAAAIGPVLIGVGALTAAVGALGGPISILIVGVGALAAAWASNWGNIQQVTFAAWSTIVGAFQRGSAIVSELWDALTKLLTGKWSEAMGRITGAMGKLGSFATDTGREFVGNLIGEMAKWQVAQQRQFDKVQKGATDAGEGIGRALEIPAKKKLDPVAQELKQFAEAMASAQRALAAARAGEGEDVQALAAQYRFIGKERLRDLANVQMQTKGINDAREAQKRALEAVDKELDQSRIRFFEANAAGTVAAEAWRLFGEAVLKAHPGVKRFNEIMKLLSADQREAAQSVFDLKRSLEMETELNAASDRVRDLRNELKTLTTSSRETKVAIELFPATFKAGTAAGQTFQEVVQGLNADQQALIQRTKGLQDAIAAAQAHKAALADLAQSFQGVFEQAFANLDKGFAGFFQSVIQGVEQLIQQIAARFLAAQITKLLFSLVPGGGDFLSGLIEGGNLKGKAMGGPVGAGQPFVVGEKGPELFVPRQAGRIEPAAGGMRPIVVNMTVVTPDANSFRRSESQVSQSAAMALRRAASRAGEGF
jgi:tape measure domain-containing protein